jgi:RNA recognition motif-containing protein
LKHFFGAYNLNVAKVKLLMNAQGQSKGSGIVEFNNALDADFAVKELNGTEIDSSKRKIIIEAAK